jgi:MOSC domain-containing protein YiiM
VRGHETAGGEQSPVVTAIHVAPASRLPMRAVESVRVEAGLGMIGDRYHGTKHRHVTVQSQTALDAATEDLGGPVEPGGTRRNITISHGDVPTTPGERLRIGDVDLEVVRAAAPCKLLDDVIGTGARTALHRRAGSVFRALSSGSIAVGDPVRLAPWSGAPAVNSAEHAYSRIVHGFDDLEVSDGDVVAPALIPRALTAGELVFSDGATQVFEANGGTTYVEHGRPTRGEWYVDDDGHFGSFWPPSYRASYDLRWMVEDGAIVGLRFTELGRGSRFDGRYRD